MGGTGLGGGRRKKGVRTVLYDNYGSAYGVTSKHIFLPLLIYNLICFTHDFNFTWSSSSELANKNKNVVYAQVLFSHSK